MISQERLLIIDPFKNLLDIYRIFLEEENYSIETASNLKEACQKLSVDRYAVVITEFLPPFEEVFSMIRWIKERSPETYILIMTNAIIDEKTYGELINLGVDDLILKPYSFQKVLIHVKKGVRIRDLILRKIELEKESVLDPIAQKIRQPVFNFIHFKTCLRQEWKKAKRHRRTLSLILIETPSKIMADNRLESLTTELLRIFRTNVREEDVMGRGNGGFGILLPETGDPGSQALVKRLSHLMQNHPPFLGEENLRSILPFISFQTFTYPEKFVIPESLRSALEELPAKYRPS
jgi:DNA-binding response OmpR family regulator